MLKCLIRNLFFGFAMITLVEEVQCGMRPRIVGGKAISSSEAPYHLSMTKAGEYFCGAALLTPICGVTAAHCFDATKKDQKIMVRGGVNKLHSPHGVYRKLLQRRIHPRYNNETMTNDIALFLIKPIRHKNISKVCVSDQPLQVGQKGNVSGYGLISQWDWEPSEVLNMVELKVMGKKKCMELYGNRADPSHPSMFCAESVNGGTDACSGDSGGAFVSENRLIGIISWAIGCALANTPGVYTNIFYTFNWVKNESGILGCGEICT